MAYEEELPSLDEVTREISILDPDAGIRVETILGKEECFVFITRSGSGYALAIYESVGGQGKQVPGRRLDFRFFRSSDSVSDFLRGMLTHPYRAFSY